MIGIYIRVSTATQAKDGYSLAAQKERLTAYCKAHGWNNYKFYIEKGLSAKDTKRPVYQEMMNHVKEGKINTVLVYKLDRIMRSIGELDKMLREFEKHNCSFKSATEPFDTTNATGKLFIYLVGALAQWEIELNSERIKMALNEKVSKGERIGMAPYPFDQLEDNTLVPNPERAKKTLMMIEKYEKGVAIQDVADFMQSIEETNKTWRATTVLRILRNPALCGDSKWNDEIIENTHEGIISKERYKRLQTMIDDRSRARKRVAYNTYLFQQKIVCPSCGNFLSVNRYIRKRPDGSEYRGATYRCGPCAKKNLYNKAVGERRYLNALYEYMKNFKLDDLDIPEKKDERYLLKKQLDVIKKKRAKYQKAWANDLMTDEEFAERMNETKKPLEELKEKINNYKTPELPNIERIKNVVTDFNQNFRRLTLLEKQEFISKFIRKIHFKLIPQKSKRPDKYKRGKDLVVITKVFFY